MSGLENRLGNLLVDRGYIDHQQLTDALEYQAKLGDDNFQPLGKVLINFGYITREQLEDVLKEQAELRRKQGSFAPPPPPPPVQKQSVQEKIAPPLPPPAKEVKELKKEVKEVLIQKPFIKSRKPLGEILVDNGFIDHDQLTKALEYQSTLPPTYYKPIGEIMVELGYITREQLNLALGVQKPLEPNPLGQVLKDLGFINDVQLAKNLIEHYSLNDNNIMPIGEILIQHGLITREQLMNALELQKKYRN